MADPAATPVGILGSLAWAGITIIPFLGLAMVIALAILVFIFLRNQGGRDQMKEMYLEMVKEAKNAPPPNLKELFRMDFPRLNEFVESMRAGNLKKEQYELLINQLKKTTPGIYYGKITGHNVFDLMATVEDLFLNEKINEDQKKEAQELIKAAGGKLHLLVYEKKKGWLFGKEEQGLFCFDDQLLGIESDDGKVSFLGTGTQRQAVYFQTPSGYPERAMVMQTHLVSQSRTRTAMLLESNIIEFVLNAVNFDTTAMKTIELYASREATGPRPTEEVAKR